MPYNDLGAKKVMMGETKLRPVHEGPGAALTLHTVVSALTSHNNHVSWSSHHTLQMREQDTTGK